MFCYIVTPDCTGSTQHACGLQAKFYASVNAAVPKQLNKPKGAGKGLKDDRHPQIPGSTFLRAHIRSITHIYPESDAAIPTAYGVYPMYRNNHSEPPGLSEPVLYRFWLNL